MPSAPPEPAEGLILNHSGCQEAVGYVIDLNPPIGGGVSCWLDIAPRHLNRNGILHGGYMAMLLDIACGYAASMVYDAENLALMLTVSLNTSYVAPVQSGRVTAIGRVTGHGRSICHASGELRDGDDRLIATATGVFKRTSPRPTSLRSG